MSHNSHFFDIEDAKKYGVDKAILLSNLRFWLMKNAANESNGHDGYYWTYNSSKAFERLFPYWTSNKIQKDLKALEKLGVIKSGNYNKAKFDRTKWYTIPLEFPISQNAEHNQPNGVMDKSKPLNELSRSAEPIPDINTDINTDIKEPCSPEDEHIDNQFSELWKVWPNAKNKIRSVSAFKAKVKGKSPNAITQTVNGYKIDIQERLKANQLGFAAMMLSTYLNNERYNDDITNGNNESVSELDADKQAQIDNTNKWLKQQTENK